MKAKEKTRQNPLNLTEFKGFEAKTGIMPKEIAKQLNLEFKTYYLKRRGKFLFTIEELIILIKIFDLDLEQISILFNDDFLRKRVLEYKNRISKEVQKNDLEYFKKLLKDNEIKMDIE